MTHFSWEITFRKIFNTSTEKYQSGERDIDNFFSNDDLTFLNSIGYKPREFFDFVEDFCDIGAPSPESALLIAAARRDYFLVIQKENLSRVEVTPNELPSRDSTLDNIPWLPRIITKARAKLRGELHPDVMYSCQGDLNFLKSYDVHPADFLRAVWAAGENDSKITSFLKGEYRNPKDLEHSRPSR